MVKQDKNKQEIPNEQNTINPDEKAQQDPNTDNSSTHKVLDENNVEMGKNQEENPDQGMDQEAEIVDEKDLMIKSLQEKNDELNDKYLRLFSEFDNFRKRSIKERLELTKTASADIIEAVLPIMDDLERAYKSAIENPDSDALLEGLNLIQTKMKTTLKHKGVEMIPTVGEVFNTDFHEAITHTPSQDKKDKGKIIEEVQKGYILNGKVLRFAKVIVAN